VDRPDEVHEVAALLEGGEAVGDGQTFLVTLLALRQRVQT
jgi:hypothetical protein